MENLYDKLFLGRPKQFAEKSFLIFLLDTIVIYIIPSIILGHFIDKFCFYLKKNSLLGRFNITYIIFQLILNIIILFILYKLIPTNIMELQSTLSGVFFVALFFNMQIHLIINLQELFQIKKNT